MDTNTRLQEFRRAIRPLDRAPSLSRVNGWGYSIVGRYHHPDIGPVFVGAYVLTVAWIPICPMCLYVMTGEPLGSYRFYGTILASDFVRIFPGGLTRLVLSCLGETLLWLVGIIAFLFAFGIVVTLIRKVGR